MAIDYITPPPVPGVASSPRRVLPGFGLSLGYTIFYLLLIVLIPLSATLAKTATMSWPAFVSAVTSPRVLASFRLSFGASLCSALINALFGLVVAWTLVRCRFPGRRLVDSLVDLPFALPTAVAGIALTTLYAPSGWIGRWLEMAQSKLQAQGGWLGGWMETHRFQAVYSPLGVIIALTFIGLPFVVRTVQPVLEDLDTQFEQAARSLGASRWQTFRRVVFPEIWPALVTGFALAFARGLGEYGSVVFISGNMPMRTEITPLLIITKLEQYDYAGATAIAVVMLAASFALLLLINLLQRWTSSRHAVV